MPSVSVDHRQALENLENAVRDSATPEFQPASRFKDQIMSIIGGTHLTYRYILATALLAKATESKINPLALQSGANVAGAYDARSLCHKVIVPYEAKLLANGLGGSNEPFLNKPARYTTVDLGNAVRAGKDRRSLLTLHAVLSVLHTQREARLALRDLAYVARQQNAVQTAAIKRAVEGATGGRQAILSFLGRLISSSVHGETSVLATAALFWILSRSRGQSWTIQVHAVNECGASSNEIGDIDVYFEDRLILTAEVKDKDFKMHDVQHAVEKAAAVGARTLHFVRGPRGRLRDGSESVAQANAGDHQVELLMLDLSSLIPGIVAFAPKGLELGRVAEELRKFARAARVKPETLHHLADSLS